jgi:glycosyltransferase involved in cell wall biosynthesis
MKHVWILNHYAQEPGGAGGTRHFHLAEHLANLGWEATVLAASVELNSGRQRLAPQEPFRHERFGSVPFLWVRTPGYEGNGPRRMLNMLAYTWQVLRPRVTRQLPRPAVVIGSSVHPLAAVAGALLARRFKVPFVFEVRDLWPQTLIDMGRLPERSFVACALRKLEQWLYRRATRIIVLLPRAWEYIVPLGVPKEQIVWIPNGVDLSLFPPSPAPVQLDSRAFTLMYFGAHGQANGLETLIDAMDIVRTRFADVSVHLRLIGEGPLKPQLIAQAQRLGLTSVSFEPPVPKLEIPRLARDADAFVIVVRDLPNLYRFGISMNKLFDYLAAGRPIVSASSAANDPVAEAGAGLSVRSNNPAELARAIVRLINTSPLERSKMAAAGRHFVEAHHSYAALSARLAAVLDEVCGANLTSPANALQLKSSAPPHTKISAAD